MFQPIDFPWVSNTGCEPNASGEEPICNERKHHFARREGSRQGHEQRSNQSQENKLATLDECDIEFAL